MPKLQAKVEGKGNGIKTVIVNMVDVAKALGRPPTYPTKYFGCELGAQTQFDFKDERYIVNGSHDATKLQDLLDGFIKKFVLCPECDNPETTLTVQTKKEVLNQTCKACGYSGVIKGGHRLINYIIKNPPDSNPAQQGASLTQRKRKDKGKSQNGGDSPRADDDQDGEDDDDWNDNWDDPPSKENGKEDEDWSVDVSEEAVRKRQQDLSDGVKGLTVSDDLDKPEKDRMDIFYKFLQAKIKSGSKVDDKELLSEAERLDIRNKATIVVVELLIDSNILQQIKTHRKIFLRFCHDNPKAQRYLLGGIEQVINQYKDILLPKSAHILKALYDEDIVVEEVLIDWDSKISKKYVSKELSAEIHAKAAPFIKWLKEAEEESSEEDGEDSEDDVEIEYDDRAKISSIQAKPTITPEAPAPVGSKEEGDDVDIDAI
jgi:translation initiation factor 5